ncbi:unnamed protein product [Leptosia nina]|uniref:Peptidase S1 domain-containing protein n=1 Tax=Leptosia nina TaxID=320188 RepID=A0AAV1J260_9NEOP
MKPFTLLVSLALCVAAVTARDVPEWNSAWNYMERFGIPEAKRIRAAEEEYLSSRITGGSPANLGEFPYQAGLISSIIGTTNQGVCGGVLLSANRVITAAHCWYDGSNQAYQLEVVLGSILLFSGGTRIISSDVVLHSDWIPILSRNDVAMIRLPQNVLFSSVLSPIALPSGSELSETFAGATVVASGFGFLGDYDDAVIRPNQFLSGVTLSVITNEECRSIPAFAVHVIESNLCTSGANAKSPCRGDSGGPLTITRNNRKILIGLVSFGMRAIKMKFVIIVAALAAYVAADVSTVVPEWNTAWNYMERFGIPEAERIRKAEERYVSSRIAGGTPAKLGEFPYQAGLISDIVGKTGRGVCGGSLLSANRVLTAAHCWYDGNNQAWRFEVILGSVLLFSGGTRMHSQDVVMHSGWFPFLIRNDIAMIRLPQNVEFSSTISTVALPSGLDIFNNFAGQAAVASGFGLTRDGLDVGIERNQSLSGVTVPVITNDECRRIFPLHVVDSNLCINGANGRSTCRGDSGGPLVVTRNNQKTLIGVTSFGLALGCTIGFPAAFVRVTSFMDFINTNLN